MQKCISYCTVFALFYFELGAIFKYKPLGAYFWRGLLVYMEGFIFRILQYVLTS